jgi:SAM-dependent methyltransferase
LKHIKFFFPESNILLADGQDLPFPDEEFGAVIGYSSYDTIPNLDKAISEAHRVTKPSGMFVHFLDMFPSIHLLYAENEGSRILVPNIEGYNGQFGGAYKCNISLFALTSKEIDHIRKKAKNLAENENDYKNQMNCLDQCIANPKEFFIETMEGSVNGQCTYLSYFIREALPTVTQIDPYDYFSKGLVQQLEAKDYKIWTNENWSRNFSGEKTDNQKNDFQLTPLPADYVTLKEYVNDRHWDKGIERKRQDDNILRWHGKNYTFERATMQVIVARKYGMGLDKNLTYVC